MSETKDRSDCYKLVLERYEFDVPPEGGSGIIYIYSKVLFFETEPEVEDFLRGVADHWDFFGESPLHTCIVSGFNYEGLFWEHYLLAEPGETFVWTRGGSLRVKKIPRK